jgi:hypothetical protein
MPHSFYFELHSYTAVSRREVIFIGRGKYKPPVLIEFGSVGELTLGANGTLPDYDVNMVLVDNNCLPETFMVGTVKYRRVFCIEAVAMS